MEWGPDTWRPYGQWAHEGPFRNNTWRSGIDGFHSSYLNSRFVGSVLDFNHHSPSKTQIISCKTGNRITAIAVIESSVMHQELVRSPRPQRHGRAYVSISADLSSGKNRHVLFALPLPSRSINRRQLVGLVDLGRSRTLIDFCFLLRVILSICIAF